MKPAIVMGLVAILFVATHIGLATGRIRASLVARLGERGFAAMFSVIASLTFAALVEYYATHRFFGAPGIALGSVSLVRWILIATVVIGIMLTSAGSASYAGSPYDLVTHRVRPPYGIERVTRHPFFMGVALLGLAHTLLATHLIGTIHFAMLTLLAAAGTYHQDRKLLARLGQPYGEYLEHTSSVPFVAITMGRQKMEWRELPLTAMSVGLVVSMVLRAVHDHIFDFGGIFVISGVVGGAAIFGLHASLQARKMASARSIAAKPSLGSA
jgi:uncharacterized membrane protein